MTTELDVLALSVLLWATLLVVAALGANRQLGADYLLGPRDEGRALGGWPARCERALKNHTESLVLFTAAVVVTHLAAATGPLTAWCAWAYLAARVLYVPAYAFAWVPWRTLFWSVGFVATLIMVVVGLLR